MLLFGLPTTRDAEQNRQSREIFERLVEVSAENGWAEYRTHIAFMDKVAEMYSFNDHAMRRFHETLKDAVDPNGICRPESPASGHGVCGMPSGEVARSNWIATMQAVVTSANTRWVAVICGVVRKAKNLPPYTG